jgi:hypothetical protein
MPIRSAVNQYPGANAHLLSYCQAAEKTKRRHWEGFHDGYIIHAQATLGAALEPYGYVVENVTSLQVRERDPETGPAAERFYPERSDLGVLYDPLPEQSYPPPSGNNPVTPGSLTLPIPDTIRLKPSAFLHALAIREIKPSDDYHKIVAWIELLSPSNKPGGADARDYFSKRLTLIAAEIPLIEIDLLHKQTPVLAGVPIYRPGRGQVADAKAYSIAITDPRPDSRLGGYTQIFPFDVDAPFPTIPVPLLGEQSYPFNFGVPFNLTFAMAAHYRLADYEQLPDEFDSYLPRDQAVIRARMRAVNRHRHELDHGPFPIDLQLDSP